MGLFYRLGGVDAGADESKDRARRESSVNNRFDRSTFSNQIALSAKWKAKPTRAAFICPAFISASSAPLRLIKNAALP